MNDERVEAELRALPGARLEYEPPPPAELRAARGRLRALADALEAALDDDEALARLVATLGEDRVAALWDALDDVHEAARVRLDRGGRPRTRWHHEAARLLRRAWEARTGERPRVHYLEDDAWRPGAGFTAWAHERVEAAGLLRKQPGEDHPKLPPNTLRSVLKLTGRGTT